MPPKSKAPAASIPILILTEKGDVKEGTIKGTVGEVTLDTVKSYYKKKQVIECIGTYPYKINTLFIFGATEGKEGTENNHQLPPPHDSTTVYGDIVLLASKDEESFDTPIPFKIADYEQFYTRSFGGYTSENDEEEEIVEEGKEFAVQDDEDIEVDEEPDEVEEEDEEEDEEVEVEAEAEAEAEADAPAVVKPKAKKKKAATKASAAAATNAYPDKPTLSEDQQLQEELTDSAPTNPQRIKVLESLQTVFADKLELAQIQLLESCIYNGAIIEAKRRHVVRTWDYPVFTHIYRMRARNIASNFNSESYVENKELFELFQQGSVDFKAISGMNTYELFPSRWRDQFEKQQIREKKQLEGNRDMATDQFICTRCRKRECTYYEMQTRSADEPMTIFITCLNCGKHWRQ